MAKRGKNKIEIFNRSRETMNGGMKMDKGQIEKNKLGIIDQNFFKKLKKLQN